MCNLADCIKVACDFVSPENVERCGVLTREFREQNQLKAWKEDVLQLRTMMWFAWLSCAAQEKRLRESEAKAKARNDTSPAPDPASTEQPASGSGVVPPMTSSQPSVPANGPLPTHPVPTSAPSGLSGTSDEGAGSFRFVQWERPRELDSPPATLPVPLLTQPSNEVDGDRPPASIQAILPTPPGAHSARSTPIADISALPSTAENVILNETVINEPSTAWSGEVPMVVDSIVTLPSDPLEVSAGPKRVSPETGLDLGPPAKRHKAEVGAGPPEELEAVPAAA